MKKSVFLTVVVCLQWLNVAHATLKRAQWPLDIQSMNDTGLVGKHSNAGTLELSAMDGVFVLMAKPKIRTSGTNSGEFRVENNTDVRLDGSKPNAEKKYVRDKNGRFMAKNARWHNASELYPKLRHHNPTESAIQYMEEMLSGLYTKKIRPKFETLPEARIFTSKQKEDITHQGIAIEDNNNRFMTDRKHEAALKKSKKPIAKIETRRKRKSSCTQQGRCDKLEHVVPKNTHRDDDVNEKRVSHWVTLFKDREQTKKSRRSVEASRLLRCQSGHPPQINLPVYSRLSLDTQGADLDQNTECHWNLRVADGRGFIVRCYLQRDKEGALVDTSSVLTIIAGPDKNGVVKTHRLNRRVHHGLWFFQSPELRITFTAGHDWVQGSPSYACDVFVK